MHTRYHNGLRGPRSGAGTSGLGTYVVCAAVFCALVACSPGMARAAAGLGEPTSEEIAWMRRLLVEIRANHDKLPVSVVNTINSLTKTVSWKFRCPRGARFKEIEMQVSTNHVHWDLSRLRQRRAVGGYAWRMELNALAGQAKVVADNWIMLDTEHLALQERMAKATGEPSVSEQTLYHELLHGEILLLAMATPEWQRKACDKQLDLEHLDAQHHMIDPAVNKYVERRTTELADVAVDADSH